MNHRETDDLCQTTRKNKERSELRYIFLPKISPAKNTHEFGDLCVGTYRVKRAFMMYFNRVEQQYIIHLKNVTSPYASYVIIIRLQFRVYLLKSQ